MAELPTHLREAFEAFWSAVPKRPADRPGKARMEFAQLVKRGVDPQALVRAAGRYAADVRAPTRFIADTIKERFVPVLRRAFGVREVEFISPRGGP